MGFKIKYWIVGWKGRVLYLPASRDTLPPLVPGFLLGLNGFLVACQDLFSPYVPPVGGTAVFLSW